MKHEKGATMNVKPRTANSPNEDPVGESIKRRVARWERQRGRAGLPLRNEPKYVL